jgi:hypothetical protein
MLKSEEYRDLDFWGFGFLVVVDFVLFLVFDLGEDGGLDGVGFMIESNEGWIMVSGVASVMTFDGLGKGSEGLSVVFGAVVVGFDGDGFCGEVLVGEV